MKQIAIEDMVSTVIWTFLETEPIRLGYCPKKPPKDFSGLLEWDDVRNWFSGLSDEEKFKVSSKLIDIIMEPEPESTEEDE